jgi:hypothetical protein
MNKRYLPAIASLLILAMVSATVLPAYANALVFRANPTLVVRTIPEDDEFRKTGIILLGGMKQSEHANDLDLMAQFKLLVSYNGIPVKGTVYCQIIEKDKVNPLKGDQQSLAENLVTKVTSMDVGICKVRWGKDGVGVIDFYWTGPSGTTAGAWEIADYVLVVTVAYTIGRSVVWGAEMQDVCVLGWSLGEGTTSITKPDGKLHYVFPNALGDFVSCEDAAMYQKHVVLDLPIPQGLGVESHV